MQFYMAKILNKKNDIDIHTLEKVNLHEILTVFNESFSDYFVPIKISLEQLQTKITSENIQMEISVGAFINNKLVGFIMKFLNRF